MPKNALTVLKQSAPSRDDERDRAAGKALTEQYRKAMNGMLEIVTFGAMVIQVRTEIQRVTVANGGHGKEEGGGLKAWLSKYAPEVNERTARRFMELAETVRELVKLSSSTDMVQLLTSSASQLNGALAKKRQQIEKLIEGQSQRQIMLMLDDGSATGPARRGGDNEFQLWLRQNHPDLAGTKLPKCPEAVQQEWAAFIRGKQLSPAELAQAEQDNARAEWTEIADRVRRHGTGTQRTWTRLKQSEISALADLFDGLAGLMKDATSQI